MCVTSLRLCLTLCDPVDCGLPGSSVHGMPRTGVGFHSPARILEWFSMLSSRGSSLPRDLTCVSYMSCIGRWILFHKHYLGSPSLSVSESGICSVESNSVISWICSLLPRSFVHGILQFLSEELNPNLLRCRQILYHLSHQGKGLILNTLCSLWYKMKKLRVLLLSSFSSLLSFCMC